MTQGALHGIRVLDLASVIMGPMAAQHLGDMGADVIKVEAPEGDVTRRLGPARSEHMGAVFLGFNRNKRSIVLDLKNPSAQAVLHRLIAQSDVVIHSIRSRAAQRIGLSYEALSAHNPGLIYCHLKGFSDKGLYAGQPAFDDIIQALSGLAMLQTSVTEEPRYVPSSVADKICAVHAAYAVSIALIHKLRTGEGQEVSLPMFETMAAFNVAEHQWGHAFEPPIAPMGYPTVRSGARRPIPTSDGYISFLPYSEENWHNFFRFIGKPHLIDDPVFGTPTGRGENWQQVYEMVNNAFRDRPSAEWLALCRENDIPCSVVQDMEALAADPHLQSVDFWQTVTHPTEGLLRMPSNPLAFTQTPPRIRRMPPRLGQHTREVLKEFSFEEAEINDLIRQKIVAAQPESQRLTA